MKKFLSIILSLIMIFTALPMAVGAYDASECIQLAVNDSLEITVEAGNKMIFSFIPDESDYYTIISVSDESLSTDPFVCLYNSEEEAIATADDIDFDNDDWDFSLTKYLEAGKTYFYEVGSNNDADATFYIMLTVGYEEEEVYEEITYIPVEPIVITESDLIAEWIDDEDGGYWVYNVSEFFNDGDILTVTNNYGTTDYYFVYCMTDENDISYAVFESEYGELYECRINSCSEEGWSIADGGIFWLYGKNSNCAVDVTLVEAAQEYIEIGRNDILTAVIENAGDTVIFKFVPQVSESVAFTSVSDYDTVGYLYDSDMNLITSDDDSGKGSNFKIVYSYVAGATYYFKVKFYSGDRTGSFDVKFDCIHDYDCEVVKEATCKEPGQEKYTCVLCGDVFYEETYVYDHDFDDGKVVSKPTCTKSGEKVYTCKICGEKVTETVKALGHKYEDGVCKVCGVKNDLSSKLINLAFVVDTTGSMGDEIDAVRNNLEAFVDIIAGTNATLRISLINYQDITHDGMDSTVVHYAPSGSVWYENSDVEALKNEIGELYADDGGDYQETPFDALGYLIDPSVMQFNSNAAKFAFLITDASYKNDNRHGIEDVDDMIAKLNKVGIATSVITDLSSDCLSAYKPLAEKTNGIIMDIYGDFLAEMQIFSDSIIAATADYVPDESIIPVESISFKGITEDNLLIPAGKLRNFIPIVLPENATNKSVTWKVEDDSVAQIVKQNENMLVIKGNSIGNTKILASTNDGGYIASFDLEVRDVVIVDGRFEACDEEKVIEGLGEDIEGVKDYYVYNEDSAPLTEGAQNSIYGLISGTDKTISYVFDDSIGDLKYLWNFAGESINDADISVDFDIDVNNEESETYKKAEEIDLEDAASFDFEHDGELPGRAKVSVYVGDEYEDGTYYLYLYNTETQQLEICEQRVVVKDGVATFELEHCSSYVMSKNAAVMKGDVNGDGKISVVDAKWVLQSIAGTRELDANQIAAADVNGDGKLSVVDAKWILQSIAGTRELG